MRPSPREHTGTETSILRQPLTSPCSGAVRSMATRPSSSHTAGRSRRWSAGRWRPISPSDTASRSAARTTPVSYTHLDVYKRQLACSTWFWKSIWIHKVPDSPISLMASGMDLMASASCAQSFCLNCSDNLAGKVPVSYTHLL